MTVGSSNIEWARVVRELRRRLEQFKRLIARRRPDNAGLLRLRARVLDYLVSRYDDEPPAGYDAFSGEGEGRPMTSAKTPQTRSRLVLPKPRKGPLCLPKSSALIRDLLEDIHHLNDFRHPSNHLNGNHC